MITVAYSDVFNRAAELAGRTRDRVPTSEATMLQGYISIQLQDIWNRALWPELRPDPVLAEPDADNRQFSKNEYNGPAPASVLLCQLDYATPDLFFSITCATAHQMQTGAYLTIEQNEDATINAAFLGTWQVEAFSATVLHVVIADQHAAFGNADVEIQRPQEMGDILAVWTANPLVTTKYRAISFEEGDGVVRVFESRATVYVEYVLPRPDLMSLSGSELNDYAIPGRFSNILALHASGTLLKADGLPAGATNIGLAEAALRDELNRLVLPTRLTAPRMRSSAARPCGRT